MTSAIGMAKGMNDVERFELTGYVDTKNSGDYVRYTDYAEVRRLYQAEISAHQQQLAAAREELAITRASLEARNEQLAGCESALGAAREDAAKAREAEADAARYRAMRHAGWGKGASRDLWFDILRAETPDQLDAAINATLQRDRQP